MSLQIALYRFHRLRRLIVLACLIPLAVVALVWLVKGPAALALVPLAVLPPLLHVLVFPTVWTETVAVSLTMAILLALAATIGPDIGLTGLAVRIGGLVILGVVLFLMLILLVPRMLDVGAARPVLVSARRRSRLDALSLKRAITLYPGRSDAFVTCGPADADGLFEIRLHHRMGSPDAVSADGSAAYDVMMHGIVHTDRPDRFELFSIDEDGDETFEARTRFEFRTLRRGTEVTITEATSPMAAGHRLGFWLVDHLADYLTDEVDRAEGRPMRANRFQVNDQLIVAIARQFSRKACRPGPAE